MNSENSTAYEYHVLVLKLTDKFDVKIGQKSVALSKLSISYIWKNIKRSYNNNNLKYRIPHGVIRLISLMGATLLVIYKTILIKNVCK